MSPQALVVYDWLTKPGFLIFAVAGRPLVLEAAVADTASTVLDRVPAGTGAFLFHLNCTLTHGFPVGRRPLIEGLDARGIRVLNRGVTDISKAYLQARCLALGLPSVHTTAAGGAADDIIIVKSNLNYGGANEWALTSAERDLLGVGSGSTMIYEPSHYLVLPRREVQPEWWRDPQLACERFVGNEEGRWFRGFRMLKRFVLCEMRSPDDVKKVGTSQLLRSWMITTGREDSVPTDPAAALAFRNMVRLADDLGLDFGAIDAVVDSGGLPFLIDVNTTPAYYSPAPGLAEHLRGGLEELTNA